MNKAEIQAFIREHGVPGFRLALDQLLEGRKLPNGATIKLNPQQFSLRELWEGMVGSIQATFDNGLWQREAGALDATGFPSATEKLLSTVTIAGYESQRGVADILVPRSTEPKTLTERMIGFTTAEASKPVLPGEDYPNSAGFGEKYVTFEEALHNKKEGVEIQVTEEAIRLDQTNMLLQKAEGIGMSHQTERERRTVRAVLGIGRDTGTALDQVYFPSGVDTALYRAAVSNLRTNAAPIYNHPGKTADSRLEDYTDLQEALTVHSQNVTDDRQQGVARPIVWNPTILLLPVALSTTAANILQSNGIVYIANLGTSSAPEIRHNAPNPLGVAFRGQLPTPVASVYVDEISATQWALYDAQRAFIRINIFPFATFRPPVGYGYKNDVVFALKVREWSRCIALDHRVVQKSTGS